MQNLTELIAEAKRQKRVSENDILNIIREYLQVMILKGIYQSKYGKGLSFIGGTCLRICYDLKRYSEDLDFAIDRLVPKYSFLELNELIKSFLKNTGFEVDMNVVDAPMPHRGSNSLAELRLGLSEDKIVQKSFIKVGKVLHFFGVSPLKTQKLHVKLEIDTNPVPVNPHEMETFFVTKFNEIFPVLKHTEETLFAGKICAVLNRGYTKGRDFYDLIWYLKRGTKMNLKYLNRSFKQAKLSSQFKNEKEVIAELGQKIATVNTHDILKDIGRFLEDSTEENWLKDYPEVFKQVSKRFLEKAA